MDEIHLAPPKAAWNERLHCKYQQTIVPMVSTLCEQVSSIHSMAAQEPAVSPTPISSARCRRRAWHSRPGRDFCWAALMVAVVEGVFFVGFPLKPRRKQVPSVVFLMVSFLKPKKTSPQWFSFWFPCGKPKKTSTLKPKQIAMDVVLLPSSRWERSNSLPEFRCKLIFRKVQLEAFSDGVKLSLRVVVWIFGLQLSG